MAPEHPWSDAWLLQAVLLAGEGGPVRLEHVIARGDEIEHAIFTLNELRYGISRLQAAGLLAFRDGLSHPTAAAIRLWSSPSPTTACPCTLRTATSSWRIKYSNDMHSDRKARGSGSRATALQLTPAHSRTARGMHGALKISSPWRSFDRDHRNRSLSPARGIIQGSGTAFPKGDCGRRGLGASCGQRTACVIEGLPVASKGGALLSSQRQIRKSALLPEQEEEQC
jgi:hypothetical protein